jgi:predicted peroxiredoxin
MKKLILILIAFSLAILFSCTNKQTMNQAQNERDGVFIHIQNSYKAPQKVLMPLKMAKIMSTDKDVLIYLDIDAVKFVVKGAADISKGEFKSAHSYLKELLAKNVDVIVCPSCLKEAGYSKDDLMAGIKLAEKEKFFNFTKGRIISLDY